MKIITFFLSYYYYFYGPILHVYVGLILKNIYMYIFNNLNLFINFQFQFIGSYKFYQSSC